MSQPDRDYQAKIQKALVRAVVIASIDPETGLAVIRSGEVISACLTMIAMMAATSDATSSPTKTRELCGAVAKRLRSMIAETKNGFADDGAPFLVVHDLEPAAGPLH